jgi:HPr kinase/phosphorylase
MPVAPGRNVAILVEVAARNQLLRSRGHHAARTLVERIDRQIASEAAGSEAGDDAPVGRVDDDETAGEGP